MSRTWLAGTGLALLCGALPASAQAGGEALLFRCAGPPALYIVDARLASQRGCKAVSLAWTTRPRVASAARAEPDAPVVPISPAARFVSSTQQRERDADRVRILREELQTERERLAALLERPAQSGGSTADAGSGLSRDVERVQLNIAALQRELSAAHAR
jgi:hypothetical protein